MAAAILATVVAACSGSDNDGTDSPGTDHPPSGAPDGTDATSEAAPAGEAAAGEDRSAGGAGNGPLAFGQPHTLAGDHDEVPGLSVTPVEFIAGAPEDLAGLTLDADLQGSTPWYLRVRYQQPEMTVRDVELESVWFTLTAQDGGGEDLHELILLEPTGSFPRCETPSRMDDGQEVGGPYDTCTIFLAPAGTEPATIEFGFDSGNAPEATWAV